MSQPIVSNNKSKSQMHRLKLFLVKAALEPLA